MRSARGRRQSLLPALHGSPDPRGGGRTSGSHTSPFRSCRPSANRAAIAGRGDGARTRPSNALVAGNQALRARRVSGVGPDASRTAPARGDVQRRISGRCFLSPRSSGFGDQGWCRSTARCLERVALVCNFGGARALRVLLMHEGPEIRKALLQVIDQTASRANDPQAIAILDRFKSPDGLEFLMVFILIFGFLSAIVLGAAGGALSGTIMGRRNKP